MICEICKKQPATKFAKFESTVYVVACGPCSRRETYHVPIDEYFRDRDDWNEHLEGRSGYVQFRAAVRRYIRASGDEGGAR